MQQFKVPYSISLSRTHSIYLFISRLGRETPEKVLKINENENYFYRHKAIAAAAQQ
jgi:hypothetical protein